MGLSLDLCQGLIAVCTLALEVATPKVYEIMAVELLFKAVSHRSTCCCGPCLLSLAGTSGNFQGTCTFGVPGVASAQLPWNITATCQDESWLHSFTSRMLLIGEAPFTRQRRPSRNVAAPRIHKYESCLGIGFSTSASSGNPGTAC